MGSGGSSSDMIEVLSICKVYRNIGEFSYEMGRGQNEGLYF